MSGKFTSQKWDTLTVSKLINIYLMYFWLHWVFVAALRLSLVVIRSYSLVEMRGFWLQWFLLSRSTGSRHVGSVVKITLASCP